MGSIKEFTRDPFNMAILGLFSKMNSHYHYVFLEIHHDWIGSRFLIENLRGCYYTHLFGRVDKSLFLSIFLLQCTKLAIC